MKIYLSFNLEEATDDFEENKCSYCLKPIRRNEKFYILNEDCDVLGLLKVEGKFCLCKVCTGKFSKKG